MRSYSVIIPVYNRPDEVDELLASLVATTVKPLEVILVEDGSTNPCKAVLDKYSQKLNIKYLEKENSGPGLSRNAGAAIATGTYLIFFDSDCLIPPKYFEHVDQFLKNRQVGLFGGPDAAHPSFTPIQKAINFAMTGLFTTGGIRGASEKMDHFYPRSFNMGVLKSAFDEIGGYGTMRFGEDIDLSIRIIQAGTESALISNARVYHKRRTDFKKFFKQVYNSGMARIHLNLRHPGTLKIVHIFPSIFTLGCIALVLISLCIGMISLLPLFLYAVILFIDSLVKTKEFNVALLSIPATFIQLWGYGLGFLHAWFNRKVLSMGEKGAFEKNFYK